MPALGPQQYAPVDAYFERTAALTPEDRARAAPAALQLTRASGDLAAAGFLETGISAPALDNGAGLFAYHRRTSSNYTLAVRSADGTGSGWAAADHPDWGRVDVPAFAERATTKARLSRDPVAIAPGRYTVILEPQAVGDLVQIVGNSAGARQADEGRSPFVKPGGGSRIGEKVVDERVTLFSDPADPQLLARPFDGDGLPLGRQVWIENGVLRQLYYSRFWAKKQGKPATGAPSSLKMAGGTAGVDDPVRGTGRGVPVTRL